MTTLHPPLPSSPRSQPPSKTLTLGVVSYLNAKPLYHTLAGRPDLLIRPDVPARLIDLLLTGQSDVALLPIVDYWHHRDRLHLISDGCIASDGATLTVRVFSRIPPEQIRILHIDCESHTSIILARLIWLERYETNLELIPLPGWGVDLPGDTAASLPESVLLIGDKVVNQAPRGYEYEVDLGAAWKDLTGLPFVFAAWAAHRHADLDACVPILEAARDEGVSRAASIASTEGPLRGWPTGLAMEYLCDIMRFKLTDPMREAMHRFFQLAADQHGILR